MIKKCHPDLVEKNNTDFIKLRNTYESLLNSLKKEDKEAEFEHKRTENNIRGKIHKSNFHVFSLQSLCFSVFSFVIIFLLFLEDDLKESNNEKIIEDYLNRRGNDENIKELTEEECYLYSPEELLGLEENEIARVPSNILLNIVNKYDIN